MGERERKKTFFLTIKNVPSFWEKRKRGQPDVMCHQTGRRNHDLKGGVELSFPKKKCPTITSRKKEASLSQPG